LRAALCAARRISTAGTSVAKGAYIETHAKFLSRFLPSDYCIPLAPLLVSLFPTCPHFPHLQHVFSHSGVMLN
jgi:hypothetical protein